MDYSATFTELPPLSLYIHVPWCIKKCPYCDFNSHEIKPSNNIANAGATIAAGDYLSALINDFRRDVAFLQDRPIHSVFIGGGTPSLMSAEFYNSLFSSLHQFADFSQCQEITLEANPSTFEQEKFIQYRQAGINRLSIGIQSFNPEHLTRLGRVHSSDEALQAIEIAQNAKFDSFNLDLMHGLPEQTVEQALNDLSIALKSQAKHLSWYQLTIEPNTVFFSTQPTLPAEDLLGEIQDQGSALIAAHGFTQYEVSAYCRENAFQSKHNLNYWRFGDYIGIGAGAHGKISSITPSSIIRTNKTRLPQDYLSTFNTQRFDSIDALKGCNTQFIDVQDYPLEFMMNALRINEGFTPTHYSARTGLPYDSIADKIKQLASEGLLDVSEEQIRTSALGSRYLNSILEKLI